MPARQLTRMEALRLYTANNGWFFREEDRLGSIEPGKLGDVVVLSDDFLDPAKVPDEQIKRISIRAHRGRRKNRPRRSPLSCLRPAAGWLAVEPTR